MRASRRGQQFIEYLMLFAIVVIVVVAFLKTNIFKDAVVNPINMTLNILNKEARTINP